MKRSAKQWAGIAVSILIILLFLSQRDADHERMAGVWEKKYQHHRVLISWQLMNLRHEYGTRQMDMSQNTVLEIKALWDERDVLFHLLRKRKNPFPADSLLKLEQLIDGHASPGAIAHEIERIEKINETD